MSRLDTIDIKLTLMPGQRKPTEIAAKLRRTHLTNQSISQKRMVVMMMMMAMMMMMIMLMMMIICMTIIILRQIIWAIFNKHLSESRRCMLHIYHANKFDIGEDAEKEDLAISSTLQSLVALHQKIRPFFFAKNI